MNHVGPPTDNTIIRPPLRKKAAITVAPTKGFIAAYRATRKAPIRVPSACASQVAGFYLRQPYGKISLRDVLTSL